MPDGTYSAKVKLDMGPYLGTVEHEEKIEITNPPKDALKKLVKELESGPDRIRAAQKMSEFGTDAAEAVPALIKAMGDKDRELRLAACRALGSTRVDSEEVATAFLQALNDDYARVRAYANRGLGTMKHHKEKALPELIEALKDDDPQVRRYSVYGLSRLAGNDPEVVQALQDALENEKDEGVAQTIRSRIQVRPAQRRASHTASQLTRRTKCLANIKQLIAGIMQYANDHNEAFPEKLSELYPRYVGAVEIFMCPGPDGPKMHIADQIDSHTGYLYNRASMSAHPSTPVLCDKQKNHGDKGVNIGFIDGSCSWREFTSDTSELITRNFEIDLK